MACNKLKTILGTNQFGSRIDKKESQVILGIFFGHGHSAVDTSPMYGAGKSEEFIAEWEMNSQKHCIFTKANAFPGNTLSAQGVRQQLEESLKRLRQESVNEFYLHCPDHNTPITETLQAVYSLYEEGKFAEFGLANYAAWQVADIYNKCKQNGWMLPTVYQGSYSAVDRNVEKELFPCLRYYGMRFYAYSPLSAGLLTGRYRVKDLARDSSEIVGRFAGKKLFDRLSREKFWKQEYLEQVENLIECLDEVYGKGKVSLTEASYRWLYNHSMLSGSIEDGVLMGVSGTEHLKENLKCITLGPLDPKVLKTFDIAWKATSNICHEYFL